MLALFFATYGADFLAEIVGDKLAGAGIFLWPRRPPAPTVEAAR
jgi:hypothetical protein